ncbi:unnamed protein product [Closterium sp. NIES-65]|nr:unnamed protein product [Closterium sp. NIES-65]
MVGAVPNRIATLTVLVGGPRAVRPPSRAASVPVSKRQRVREVKAARVAALQAVLQRHPMGDSETAHWLNALVQRAWPVFLERLLSTQLAPALAPWFFEKYRPWQAGVGMGAVGWEWAHWLNAVVQRAWPVFLERLLSTQLTPALALWFFEKYLPWQAAVSWGTGGGNGCSGLWLGHRGWQTRKAWLERVYLGSSPPVIAAVRVVHTNTLDDHVVIEAATEFAACTDMYALVGVKMRRRVALGMVAKGHVSGVHIEGKVGCRQDVEETRIGMRFTSEFPYVSRVRVSFVGAPFIGLSVKPSAHLGFNLADLPFFSSWLDEMLATALESSMVAPNMLVLDVARLAHLFLSPSPAASSLPHPPHPSHHSAHHPHRPHCPHCTHCSEQASQAASAAVSPAPTAISNVASSVPIPTSPSQPHPLPPLTAALHVDSSCPVAFVAVEIIEARHLKPANLDGTSDAYVKCALGAARFTTRIVWGSLDPQWFAEFTAPVFSWRLSNLLVLRVLDKSFLCSKDLGVLVASQQSSRAESAEQAFSLLQGPRWFAEFTAPVFSWRLSNLLVLRVLDKPFLCSKDLGCLGCLLLALRSVRPSLCHSLSPSFHCTSYCVVDVGSYCVVDVGRYRRGGRREMWETLRGVGRGRVRLAVTVISTEEAGRREEEEVRGVRSRESEGGERKEGGAEGGEGREGNEWQAGGEGGSGRGSDAGGGGGGKAVEGSEGKKEGHGRSRKASNGEQMGLRRRMRGRRRTGGESLDWEQETRKKQEEKGKEGRGEEERGRVEEERGKRDRGESEKGEGGRGDEVINSENDGGVGDGGGGNGGAATGGEREGRGGSAGRPRLDHGFPLNRPNLLPPIRVSHVAEHDRPLVTDTRYDSLRRFRPSTSFLTAPGSFEGPHRRSLLAPFSGAHEHEHEHEHEHGGFAMMSPYSGPHGGSLTAAASFSAPTTPTGRGRGRGRGGVGEDVVEGEGGGGGPYSPLEGLSGGGGNAAAAAVSAGRVSGTHKGNPVSRIKSIHAASSAGKHTPTTTSSSSSSSSYHTGHTPNSGIYFVTENGIVDGTVDSYEGFATAGDLWGGSEEGGEGEEPPSPCLSEPSLSVLRGMASGQALGWWGDEVGEGKETVDTAQGREEPSPWQHQRQQQEQSRPRPRLERKAALSFRTRMQLERQQEQRDSEAAEAAAAAAHAEAAAAAASTARQLDRDELALLSRLHVDQSEEVSIQGVPAGSGILKVVRPGADPGPEAWKCRQGGRKAEAEARERFVEEEQEGTVLGGLVKAYLSESLHGGRLGSVSRSQENRAVREDGGKVGSTGEERKRGGWRGLFKRWKKGKQDSVAGTDDAAGASAGDGLATGGVGKEERERAREEHVWERREEGVDKKNFEEMEVEDEGEVEEERDALEEEREALEALALEMLDGWQDDVVGGDAISRSTTSATFPSQSHLRFTRELIKACH